MESVSGPVYFTAGAVTMLALLWFLSWALERVEREEPPKRCYICGKREADHWRRSPPPTRPLTREQAE